MKKIIDEMAVLIGIAIIGGLLGVLLIVLMDKWVAHEQDHQYIAPADEIIIELMEYQHE